MSSIARNRIASDFAVLANLLSKVSGRAIVWPFLGMMIRTGCVYFLPSEVLRVVARYDSPGFSSANRTFRSAQIHRGFPWLVFCHNGIDCFGSNHAD